jgi:hypothetical protein
MGDSRCNNCRANAWRLCSDCSVVRYCSEECQKLDWKTHRLECCKIPLPESVPFDFQKDTEVAAFASEFYRFLRRCGTHSQLLSSRLLKKSTTDTHTVLRLEFDAAAHGKLSEDLGRSKNHHRHRRLETLERSTGGDAIGTAVRSRGFQWKWALRMFSFGKCELFNCTAALMLEELSRNGRLTLDSKKVSGVRLLRGVCKEPESRPLKLEWSDGAAAPENSNGLRHKAIGLEFEDGKRMILDFASMQYGKGSGLGYVLQQREGCTWFESEEAQPASELLLLDLEARRERSFFWKMMLDAEAYFEGFRADINNRVAAAHALIE